MYHFHKDINLPINRAWSTMQSHMHVVMIKSISLTYLITYGVSSSHLSLNIKLPRMLFSALMFGKYMKVLFYIYFQTWIVDSYTLFISLCILKT